MKGLINMIDNPILNSYKSKLKKMRTSKGMTQSELANLSGINKKSIASYEQNPEKINKVSVEKIIILSDCLGCEVSDIVETELINK
jgi:transcriptional regulator with XRE-family HTH domain